mmetsp:Transcript_19005/g.30180  ORF Transcript_19005/g.30180 Transcript_19005/m.30180 type:complete len:251 (+) Transcript_19005:20-772(+)
MSVDLVLVPCTNCTIFIIHLLFVLFAILAWTGNQTYCEVTYSNEADGSLAGQVGYNCEQDTRCQVLIDGVRYTTATGNFACFATENCGCSGIELEDPAFNIVIACSLFFFIKLVIEIYLIWCANWLCTQQFKQDSKKIFRLSESIWLRCVQCRAPTSWQMVMNAYDSGHFYAFKERVFWVQSFLNLIFIIVAVVAFISLKDSVSGFAIFYIIGAVLTVLLMLFACFVKWKYIQWANSDDDDGGAQMGSTR